MFSFISIRESFSLKKTVNIEVFINDMLHNSMKTPKCSRNVISSLKENFFFWVVGTSKILTFQLVR